MGDIDNFEKKKYHRPGNLLSTIGDFNRGVMDEIAAADANWAQKLGKPAGYVPTGGDIQGYRDAMKAQTAARAAELGSRVRDFGKKLPLIGGAFVGVALVAEGPSAAAQTAVEVSPVGDAREVVTGVPELGRRVGDTAQAGSRAIRGALDNHGRARERTFTDIDSYLDRREQQMEEDR